MKQNQVSHDLIRDHVGEQAAHVRQGAGVGDQFGEEVVLEARRRRLHPAEARRAREEVRRDLAEEAVGVAHVVRGRDAVLDAHRPGGPDDGGEALGIDRGVDDQVHGAEAGSMPALRAKGNRPPARTIGATSPSGESS